MAARQDHTLLLDQLQEQLNLVLENTGRMFAAIVSNPKVAPVAHSYRLRQSLPGAMSQFHAALDELDYELQSAKTVMRRDLAVWREKTGHQVPEAMMGVEDDLVGENATAQGDSADQLTFMSPNGKESDLKSEHVTPNPLIADEDLEMGGTHDGDDQADVEISPNATSAPESRDAAMAPESAASQTEMADAEAPESNEKKVALVNALHLNTAQLSNEDSNQDNSDDKPPDTTDLDSLFNDPPTTSGPDTGNEGITNNGDGNNESFNFEDNGANDFDLDSFNANLGTNAADNDNISSLLPGLQDYASHNPNGSADFDFNALFDSMDGGAGQDGDQQGGEGQKDTTIEDMLDMAGDFDGGNTGDVDGHANDDLDFDSLFNA